MPKDDASPKGPRPGAAPGGSAGRQGRGRTTTGHRADRMAKPSTLSDILEHAFRSPVVQAKVKEYSAFPFWEEIVGPEISAIAVPEKIARGRVLYVRVVDSTWAQELALLKPQILEQIRRFGKGAMIDDIRCIISNPREMAEQKKRRSGGGE